MAAAAPQKGSFEMAKSILIVEDDNNIADLLRLYLEKEGYQATIAADGTQGIDLYRKLRPDLVLLDVMMPGVDGWGVLRAIRQDSQTPVIMLTAKGETTDKVSGLKQGADDYVTGSALVLILVYEYFMSKHDLLEALGRQPTAVRWSIYYLLAIILFTLGQFNSDSFIYLQF